MSGSDNAPVAAPFRGHTCRELYKAIFEADVPEQIVSQLPAQSLFMIIKQRGLASSTDLISIASIEQCRMLADFDLWHRDTLNEEALWEWLGLTDESDSLELTQKILKCLDLKLIAVLIGRYVETRVFEEPTDQPPGPGFHTPDKGFTWVGIQTENADRHFLLARLLALIFETNTELFYQLLATPSVATTTMLEEESYQDRLKRLAAEGVPEPELADSVHAPYVFTDALGDLRDRPTHKVVEDIRAIEPLIYEARSSRLFGELMRRVSDRERVEMEFTYLVNAAIVRFGIDFCEQDRVLSLCEQIKGAINIGLEKLTRGSDRTIPDVYEALGLGKLYRLGLTELMALHRVARKMSLESAEKIRQSDAILFSIIACARELFPAMPAFLNDDGSTIEDEDEGLRAGSRPIETVEGLKTVRDRIEALLNAGTD